MQLHANPTTARKETVMPHQHAAVPDDTAVRTALWRALHVQVDPPPHVFEDEVGLEASGS